MQLGRFSWSTGERVYILPPPLSSITQGDRPAASKLFAIKLTNQTHTLSHSHTPHTHTNEGTGKPRRVTFRHICYCPLIGLAVGWRLLNQIRIRSMD